MFLKADQRARQNVEQARRDLVLRVIRRQCFLAVHRAAQFFIVSLYGGRDVVSYRDRVDVNFAIGCKG